MKWVVEEDATTNREEDSDLILIGNSFHEKVIENLEIHKRQKFEIKMKKITFNS